MQNVNRVDSSLKLNLCVGLTPETPADAVFLRRVRHLRELLQEGRCKITSEIKKLLQTVRDVTREALVQSILLMLACVPAIRLTAKTIMVAPSLNHRVSLVPQKE